jgi:hypothetical protein
LPSFHCIDSFFDDTLEPSFIFGVGAVGLLSFGAGFVKNKVIMFVIRAVSGVGKLANPTSVHCQTEGIDLVGGAMTIPSALNLIVQIFTDPQEQARAIALFGGAGAIGNGATFLSTRRSLKYPY